MNNSIQHGRCRFCQSPLLHTVANLGMSPLCEDFVKPSMIDEPELFYPLHAFVCHHCLLVQVAHSVTPQHIYRDYSYFSSYSDSWLSHCKAYSEQVVREFELQKGELIAEIASNDGYLLQYFLENGHTVLGIEPALTVAEVARRKSIPTETEFFGLAVLDQLTSTYGKAKLLIGNNVFAHVPDINDFVAAMREFLAPEGIITLEFPHLLRLIEGRQFDTIYHEHYFYYSLITAQTILAHHGLKVFRVDELTTHGGSLRLYVSHQEADFRPDESVARILQIETDAGMRSLRYYTDFNERVSQVKFDLLQYLLAEKAKGKSIAAYGAPGKAATLLNYCGIGPELIEFTVDRNPRKHGCYIAGARIPIYPLDMLSERKPDIVVVLPWNLVDEIVSSNKHVFDWGGIFVAPIPELKVYRGVSDLAKKPANEVTEVSHASH